MRQTIDVDATAAAGTVAAPDGDPPPQHGDVRRPALPGAVAALLAAGSGALLVLAFPGYDLWWLAPIAVALLAVATRGQRARRGAWLGALHGAVFFTWLLHWTGTYVGPVPWLLLAATEAAYLAGMGTLLAGTSRLAARHRWTWPLVVACAWVTQEAVRSRWPWGGFPWGRLAFAAADTPFLPLASLGGAPLVTFSVALCGGLLAAAGWHLRDAGRGPRTALRDPRPWVLAAAAAAVAAAGLAVPLAPARGQTVTVAVVQGNVPRLGLDFNAQRRAVLDNHVAATVDLAERVARGEAPRPDFVVWPENASDIDPLTHPDAAAAIDRAAAAVGVPILVGALVEGPGRYVTNAGIVWSPDTGPGDRYAKRHPVPFAEYVPLRPLARRVTDAVDLVRRDFAPGDRVGALRLGPATVGDVICFEIAYDGLVADTVDHGAELLVVQTNNATFGLSDESVQQLAMVRLRAVEHGRPAVMASTSGVSATVAPDGRVLDRSDLFTRAVLVRQLRLAAHRTLSAELGAWPERLFCALSLAALLAAAGLRPGGLRRGRHHIGHLPGAPGVVQATHAPPTDGGRDEEET